MVSLIILIVLLFFCFGVFLMQSGFLVSLEVLTGYLDPLLSVIIYPTLLVLYYSLPDEFSDHLFVLHPQYYVSGLPLESLGKLSLEG